MAEGSGTALFAPASGIDCCQLRASRFRSCASTLPSALKSPSDHGSGEVFQLSATAFRSGAPTDPSKLASPFRYGSANPFSLAASDRH